MRQLFSGVLAGSIVGVVVFAQALTLAVSAPVGTVSGTVPIMAQATAAGLTSVQFFLNGAPFGAPIVAGACTASLNTTTLMNGGHTLRVSGVTTTGATVTSPDSAFTVSNVAPPPPPPPPPPPQGDTVPPVVSITFPAGATATPTPRISGSGFVIIVVAAASDNVGVVGVRVSVDGVLLEDDLVPQYDGDWINPTNGVHTLTAVARDAAGNTATATRVVTVGPVTPVPVNCTGTWSLPTVTTAACVAPGTQTVTSTRVFTITTPASNGGTACPASPEVTTTAQACTPPPPPIPLPTVTMSAKTCTLTISAQASPDGTTGWGVQYLRNGVSHGTRDTSSPFERAATVNAGSYALSAVWTKTGATTLTQDLGTRACP